MKSVEFIARIFLLLIYFQMGDSLAVDKDYKDWLGKHLILSSNDRDDSSNEFSNEIIEQPTAIDEDSWSIVWYVASFGGLILFFFIVSCSEWCCRSYYVRPSRTPSSEGVLHQGAASGLSMSLSSSGVLSHHVHECQPPPGYDQFAPPSYDSLAGNGNGSGSPSEGKKDDNGGSGEKKDEFDVYVVPVHTLRMFRQHQQGQSQSLAQEDEPPCYMTINFDVEREGQASRRIESARITESRNAVREQSNSNGVSD